MIYNYPLFFLLFICNLSCGTSYDEVHSLENKPTYKELLPEEITTLIERCIKCECHWRFNKHLGKDVLIRYSKSYFSPDSSKTLIIVVHQINGVKNRANPNVNFEIRGDAFIGYKSDGKWTLYVYKAMMPFGYYSYKEVEQGMIDFYEGKNYREKSPVYYYDTKKREKWTSTNKVSPNDPKFWDSQLWQKNIEVEGLYPFEIIRYQMYTEKEPSINELLEEVECELSQ